jgi:hypothetical protein
MDIGIELNLSVFHLDKIRETYHGNVGKCFTEILTLWLRRANPPPTWTEMVAVLNEHTVNEQFLAFQVEKNYLSDVTDSVPATETQEGEFFGWHST